MKSAINYWFYLEPDVFIFREKSRIILYNSLSKKIVDIKLSDEIHSLIQQFLNPDNLYVIPLTANELSNSLINYFVDLVRNTYCGDIIRQNNNRPVIIPPILKIHKNREVITKDREIAIGENILLKLDEIKLYLNGECFQNCEFCNKMYRQFDFCYKNTGELNIKYVQSILSRLQYLHTRIICTGGNIFKYSKYNALLKYFKQYDTKATLCFHYLNLEADKLSDLIDNVNINFSIYFTVPLCVRRIKKVIDITQTISNTVSYIFVVRNETDVLCACNIIDDNNIKDNSTIMPFFDDSNLLFFEQNVFLEESDIYDTLSSRQEIFAKQSFNMHDFGKLTVSCNGEIFANVNYPPVGYMTENIAKVVSREFATGQSWFRIRRQKPCNKCIYQWLCPSPSNYELAIGKPNLCYVKP